MYRSLKSLKNYKIIGADDEIGKLKDFLFEAETWKIRYLVAEPGSWLSNDEVQLATTAIDKPDWDTKTFHAALTRDLVRSAPNIDFEKPVSVEMERSLHTHYNWPLYYSHGGGIPSAARDPMATTEDIVATEPTTFPTGATYQLHSAMKTIGFAAKAREGDIGSIDDIIIDDELWQIRYLVVETAAWVSGKNILVWPEWADRVGWQDEAVFLDMYQEHVRNSPEYDPDAPVNREYEERLYDFHGKRRYWKDR
ncbi:MAG: PRC-barrel domain containing protein [SAR202 cluster bacterium]|nr:PRC-barrel domain containing protein [SAR202 cluster bacterium]